jgi:hypothetical protein
MAILSSGAKTDISQELLALANKEARHIDIEGSEKAYLLCSQITSGEKKRKALD